MWNCAKWLTLGSRSGVESSGVTQPVSKSYGHAVAAPAKAMTSKIYKCGDVVLNAD
jgi:hypothetical protein